MPYTDANGCQKWAEEEIPEVLKNKELCPICGQESYNYGGCTDLGADHYRCKDKSHNVDFCTYEGFWRVNGDSPYWRLDGVLLVLQKHWLPSIA
ncbi:hypothetical protein KAR91_84455 [Candidatus Pacearchaeota archaeon]|nr:hypothetical protein [Candidatus Pacearchaeota archaeon]